MKIVGARTCDDVIDVSCGAPKLRSEAVTYGLDLAHVNGRNREQAKTVAITLRVYHPIHLVVDAIHEAIGVQRARDTQLRVGVSTDTGLKHDPVIRIPRGQWQILHLIFTDRSTDIRSRWIEDRRAAAYFNRRAHRA